MEQNYLPSCGGVKFTRPQDLSPADVALCGLGAVLITARWFLHRAP